MEVWHRQHQGLVRSFGPKRSFRRCRSDQLASSNASWMEPSMRIDPMVMSAFVTTLLVCEPAMAGTDTTFNYALSSIRNVETIAVGLIDVISRFNWKLIAAVFGAALAALTVPAFVSAMVTMLTQITRRCHPDLHQYSRFETKPNLPVVEVSHN